MGELTMVIMGAVGVESCGRRSGGVVVRECGGIGGVGTREH